MNKITQLIIGMSLGFEKDHEIFKDIDWDSNMAGELRKAQKITKEDIFSLTSNGKSFFEYKETWTNIEKLFDFMKQNGEKINSEDFKRVVKDNKTARDLAIEFGELKGLFVPELWGGRADEMEEFWFSIARTKRMGLDFNKIRTALAKLEGRETREDQLAGMDITSVEMINALRTGRYDTVKEKLAKHGDHLRMKDIFLSDIDGDHALHTKPAWNSFEDLCAEWKKHAEFPDTDFFLFKRGVQISVIEYAFRYDSEKKVFNETLFSGRPGELLKLYNALSEQQKTKVDIDVLLSNLVEKTCEDQVNIDAEFSVKNLTDVLYQFEEEDGENMPPVIGLGLKKTWDNIDVIHELLKQKNQKITLEHLRLPSGFGEDTCLMRAARFDQFEKVIDLLASSGEMLQLSDYLDKPENGKKLLDVLAENDQIDAFLQPEYWVGRVEDLFAIWENLPLNIQREKKEDFQTVLTQANLLSLRALKHEMEKPKTAPALVV